MLNLQSVFVNYILSINAKHFDMFPLLQFTSVQHFWSSNPSISVGNCKWSQSRAIKVSDLRWINTINTKSNLPTEPKNIEIFNASPYYIYVHSMIEGEYECVWLLHCSNKYIPTLASANQSSSRAMNEKPTNWW